MFVSYLLVVVFLLNGQVWSFDGSQYLLLLRFLWSVLGTVSVGFGGLKCVLVFIQNGSVSIVLDESYLIILLSNVNILDNNSSFNYHSMDWIYIRLCFIYLILLFTHNWHHHWCIRVWPLWRKFYELHSLRYRELNTCDIFMVAPKKAPKQCWDFANAYCIHSLDWFPELWVQCSFEM